MVKLIECPRDAMQGIHDFIPTDDKVRYLNALLKVGFDTLDCGSFVSAKYIPQMADTAEVIPQLDMDNTDTKLSVIVANTRGAEHAVQFDEITYLGFPFSVSETFQLRNTNSSIERAVESVENIYNIVKANDKEFVVYLSMAFGNPYGDPWSIAEVEQWVAKMDELEVPYISLSDTVGVADPDTVEYFFKTLTKKFPRIEFGAHFHTTSDTWKEKVAPAWEHGCKRFDGAIKGYGGCPMANDELVGNMPTENMFYYFNELGVETGLDREHFLEAMQIAGQVFPQTSDAV